MTSLEGKSKSAVMTTYYFVAVPLMSLCLVIYIKAYDHEEKTKNTVSRVVVIATSRRWSIFSLKTVAEQSVLMCHS